MSSSRLPGKVLKPILGKPMLELQLERIAKSNLIDKIIIATSTDQSDDIIEKTFFGTEFDVFRGSLNDVLGRYYEAAKHYEPKHVIRLTGDCPLIDPIVLDSLVEYYLTNKFDYACNTFNPSFPDGQDAWIFSYKLLKDAWNNATLPSEREHVTMYFKNNINKYCTGDFQNNYDLSHHRWTVDEVEDFDKIESIYNELYSLNRVFTMNDILQFLAKNPEIDDLNKKYIRDEGLTKSLKLDQENRVI